MVVRAQSSPLTAAEFLALPADELHTQELIDGELILTPSPYIRHQEVSGRLFYSIFHHLQSHPDGRVFDNVDVVLGELDVVVPDVVFVGRDREEIITRERLTAAPALVVEVLSSDAARDRKRKRDLYARAGVPEYWIVDPEQDRVEVYRLTAGENAYPKPEIFASGEHVTTQHIPGLEIDLTWLFRR
jgi:Uma2 family endonuclease